MVSVGLENCQRDPGNFHLQIHTQSHTPLSEFIRKGVYLLMSPFSLLWCHLLPSPLLVILCSSLLVFRFILYSLVSFWSGLRNLFAYVFSSSLLVSFFVFWFSVPPLLSDSSSPRLFARQAPSGIWPTLANHKYWARIASVTFRCWFLQDLWKSDGAKSPAGCRDFTRTDPYPKPYPVVLIYRRGGTF